MIDELLSRASKRARRASPLHPPRFINIEVTSHCNYACGFCPNRLLPDSSKGMMGLQTFRTILERISGAWGSQGICIMPFLRGEPLLNPELPEMIRHCKQLGFYTFLSTNGSLMKGNTSESIIGCGLDKVYFTKPELCVENIKKFLVRRQELGSKNPKVYLQILGTDEDEVKAKSMSIAAELRGFGHDGFEHQLLHDWAGLMPSQTGRSRAHGIRAPCELPWTHMAIAHNGDVPLCCLDAGCGTILGNVLTEPIRGIWSGRRLDGVREGHVTAVAQQTATCRQCQRPRLGRIEAISKIIDAIDYDRGKALANHYHRLEKRIFKDKVIMGEYDLFEDRYGFSRKVAVQGKK